MTKIQRQLRFIEFMWARVFENLPLSQQWARALAKLSVQEVVSTQEICRQLVLSGRYYFETEDERAAHVVAAVVSHIKNKRSKKAVSAANVKQAAWEQKSK